MLRGISWAYSKNGRSSEPSLSHRLLAPGLSIPSGPALGSRSARCSFALSRARREHALTPKASAGQASELCPAPGGPGRARTAPREPPLRGPEMGAQKEDPGPPLPPFRRGSSSRPIPAYRTTGRTSTSRWKLRRREQACPSNAFQSLRLVTRSRRKIRGTARTTIFPVYELSRGAEDPALRVRRPSSVTCALPRGKCSFCFVPSRLFS